MNFNKLIRGAAVTRKWIITMPLYKVGYKEERGGYYVYKRFWLWLLISPLIIGFRLVVAFFMVSVDYFGSLTTHYEHFFIIPKQKLNIKQKAYIKERLTTLYP